MRRELQLVTRDGGILNARAYYEESRQPDPDKLRAELNQIREGWEHSGLFYDLIIRDVALPKWRA